MSPATELVEILEFLDSHICTCSCSCHVVAAKAVGALAARVAQLEACLTDVCHQIELGGIER